jgi:uncharacterized protein
MTIASAASPIASSTSLSAENACLKTDPRADKFTVIVKPTHSCNLRCIYCYVPSNAENGRMSKATLRNLMDQTVDVAARKKITFIWHGGEPLLLGLKFYRVVSAISQELRKRGHDIKNVIQTNGTLLTDEFIDFIIKEDDFRLGLSLDGPAHVNDLSRPKSNGVGSFAGIMKAVARIQEREADGVNRVGGGAICVIGRQNISRLEEIYAFFKCHGISMKITPLFVSGRATDDLSVTPTEYSDAMCRLFDTWINDGDASSIRVDPFETAIASLVTGVPDSCATSVACTKSFISVGPRGDIYPCGRFDGVRSFHLGNVNDPGGLRSALVSKIHAKLDSRPVHLHADCVKCHFLSTCNAGCIHNAYLAGNIMGKDPFCAFYKTFFGHVQSRLHSLLEEAHERAPHGLHEILGHKVDVKQVRNPSVRRILCGIERHGAQNEAHTDHHDRWSKYPDHTDHSDHDQCCAPG